MLFSRELQTRDDTRYPAVSGTGAPANIIIDEQARVSACSSEYFFILHHPHRYSSHKFVMVVISMLHGSPEAQDCDRYPRDSKCPKITIPAHAKER